MTVLPIRSSPPNRAASPAPRLRSSTASNGEVSGTFDAPSGGRGSFTGMYRVERLRSERGRLTVAGVLAGRLRDVDGTVVAIGSRRHTPAAELVSDESQHLVRFGPVCVNVAGFLVRVPEVEVAVARERMSDG